MTITADSDTKVYDGKPLTKDSYTNTALAEGDSIESVTVTGSQTVVGESANVPSAAKIVNTAGEDVTANYEITYENGLLKVTLNKSLIITADSDTKEYDGKPLTRDSYKAAGLAEGDSVETVTVTGSQTVAGISDNVPSAAKIVNAAGEDVTASYEITYVNGELEVTKKPVTITAGTDSKVYDGTPLTKYTYTGSDLAEGDYFDTVIVAGSQTNVGKSDNTPKEAVIRNAAGEDVTESYSITYVNGTLEVTPLALTITADSDEKVYDGTALTKDSYTNGKLGEGDKIESVTVTGSQTTVGSSNNVPSAAVIRNAAGENVTGNYTITYTNGTLKVTPKDLTITADSDEKEYDGRPLTKNSYTNSELAKGDSIVTVTVTGSQTLAGTSNNVPSAAKIENEDGDDVTANYNIKYVNGTLTVKDRSEKYEIEVESNGAEGMYDGSGKTAEGFKTLVFEVDGNTYTVEGLTASVTKTDAGTYPNTITGKAVVRDADGNDVTAQFDVSTITGELKIAKRSQPAD